MSKYRIAFGAIGSAVAAYIVFQLSWMYYVQQEMWKWGFMDTDFNPIAYGAFATTLTIGLAVTYYARGSEETQTLGSKVSKKDWEKMDQHWKNLMRFGTQEDRDKFKLQHPEYFGIIVNNVEKAEPFSSIHSPLEASASPPSMPETNSKSTQVIINLPKEIVQTQKAPSKVEHNGHDKDFENEMQEILLTHLRNGTLDGKFKIKNGKFIIPEDAEFSFVKQKKRKTPEASLAVPEKKTKEKSKIPLPKV